MVDVWWPSAVAREGIFGFSHLTLRTPLELWQGFDSYFTSVDLQEKSSTGMNVAALEMMVKGSKESRDCQGDEYGERECKKAPMIDRQGSERRHRKQGIGR